MKEYIPLEWFEDFLVVENIAWDGRNIPTVTKYDILFDFKNDISDAIDRHNVVLLNEVNEIYRKHIEMEKEE